MQECLRHCHAPARRAGNEAQLYQIRFDYVLNRARVLVGGGGQRVYSDGLAAEFYRQSFQYRAVVIVKSQLMPALCSLCPA